MDSHNSISQQEKDKQLLDAVKNDDIASVAAWINAGANSNTLNENGLSALHAAGGLYDGLDIAFLLFSTMTLEELNKQINYLNPYKQFQLNAFKDVVIEHRMNIFKKLGLLYIDKNNKNKKNPFPSLPIELFERIISYYVCVKNNEFWQNYHTELDTIALCNGFKTLRFTPAAPATNSEIRKEDNDNKLEDINTSFEKENYPKQKKHRRCTLF